MTDPELLAAFQEEFAAGCAALAAAPDLTAARRHVAQLLAMAEALEMAPLSAALSALEGEEALEALRAAAPVLAALASGDAPGDSPDTTARVLIVDDSATIRRLLREILATDPLFTVVGEAMDGRAGLAELARLRPDLTLLDLEMPVLDGMGFLAEWALAGPGEVVVVSSAAHPGSPAALEALRRGARAAVAKPSGALSPDLAARSGEAILRAARAALER
ncbi:response regulator [Roseococcus suduntuyensis]|uniref:CheY-like chemotaxis protein n=1 Tax=Roseococcus suduntuyensis TaxID=455361 RepID=A0A840ACB2_9PROT|nr:response regulator [Roseococcus suduntuyensis]MBB3898781.1 CheY-like chemotaxis protein [Roseococcus suduntuyensis]